MDLITPYLATLPPAVAAAARPGIRLRLDELEPAAPPVGGHRVGGRPDWPTGLAWPRWRGSSMDFLAQIDLAAIAGLPGAEDLPRTGWLAFFYTAYGETWGFSPDDAGSAAVIHHEGPREALRRGWVPPDDDLDAVFPAFTLTATPEWTLPSSASDAGRALGPDDAAREAYVGAELHLIRHYDTDSGAIQLGGHAAQFQGEDLAAACADHAPAGREAGPWRLLLQLAPPDHWGFAGVLYFFVPAADPAAGRFDRAWVVRED